MMNTEPNVLESAETRCLLDSFPDPAVILDRDHRIRSVNRAYRRLYPDADAVLGAHCYEVHHDAAEPCEPEGPGCPLRDCFHQQRTVRCLHVHRGPIREEHQDVSVHPIRAAGGALVGYLQTFRVFTAASPVPHPRRLVGRSGVFNQMLARLRAAAASEIPVLLLGEPGTGKRRAAEAVHGISARRRGPLVMVDCTGFGRLAGERGGPRSAGDVVSVLQAQWTARVAAARGGTLVLAEIGELPPTLQCELRQVLEEGSSPPAGRDSGARTDVRLVCTSSCDLSSLAESGLFAADLLSRLSPFPIVVPPLRERLEDLPLLIDSLLHRIAGQRRQEVAPDALALLGAHDFPGNIRELHDLLERAWVLAQGDTILGEHLREAWCPTDGLSASMMPGCEILPLAEVERRYLEWAIRSFDGDNCALAGRLGIAERTLYRKLRELRSGGRATRSTSPPARWTSAQRSSSEIPTPTTPESEPSDQLPSTNEAS